VQPAMTRSGSGCSLSPRAAAVIDGLLGAGACCLSAPETMARAMATAPYRPGASTVATLMMVRGEDAGGPAPCRLAAAAKVTGSGKLAAVRLGRAREDAVHNHGVF
jgi:hypothetical protein